MNIWVASAMKTFGFLFGIKLGDMILCHSDNLSRTLQHRELSASKCQVVAQKTVRTSETMRTDGVLEKTTNRRSNFEVDEAVLPRKRKCKIMI